MPNGLNIAGTFIRWVYTDDEVGGAYPTGTILHENVQARITELPADTMLLQQGLESKKIFTAMFWGHALSFHEQDEFLITSPPNHPYYNKRFRVISHQIPNNHPAIKQNYHLAKLERSEQSHAETFQ